MKRKDLSLIILVAVVASIFSFILSNTIFGSSTNNPVTIPAVQPISSSFPIVKTDDTYKAIFNSSAIDPTQLIRIGGQVNSQPFTGQ